jgi:hypothetical protein
MRVIQSPRRPRWCAASKRRRSADFECLETRRLLSGADLSQTQVLQAFRQLPLSFEANQAQTNPWVQCSTSNPEERATLSQERS